MKYESTGLVINKDTLAMNDEHPDNGGLTVSMHLLPGDLGLG